MFSSIGWAGPWAGRVAFGVALFGAGAATSLVATHPAAAAPALEAVRATVTCATTGTTPCEAFSNTKSGVGVLGSSVSGTGVRASSGTGIALKSTSTTGQAIFGESTSNNGVFGESTSTYGILGESLSNQFAGVAGSSPAGYGVYGFTTATQGGVGVRGSSASGYGVFGTTQSGGGYGVVGTMGSLGVGVYGSSASGYGVQAVTTSGDALVAQTLGSGSGVNIATGTGYALIAQNGGSVAVYGRSTHGSGADFGGTYIGVIGRAPATGGFPLVLTDDKSHDVFWVTGTGDVYYDGGMHALTPTASGVAVTTFTSKTSAPTVEDTGTAQLVGGAAAVRFDAAFAASIDAKDAYRVFLTPGGDTRGLFVASKTPAGFVVRESQGGRSTVTFDYRIVATSLGQTGRRMSFTSADAAEFPHAPLPVVRDPKRLPRALPAPAPR